ncbi:MAG: 16S rRNA (cytosine(1402)-N(4))-methyltransferase RsmH [Clostridiales bacterium]|nr:16S rRNA (cytosine(1402)-N(4))-methyltransferase RsmH [Clostridiales bacterium]
MNFLHRPVLYKETIENLNCKPGHIVVDGTLGAGGHAQGILEAILPGGILIGIDRDPRALEHTKEKLSVYKDAFKPVHGNFANLEEILSSRNIDYIDGLLLDIGVSSPQLDDASRGFTYMEDAPLDMRMNPQDEFSAYDVVNGYSKNELTKIIREFGEERWASRIAQFIVRGRPIETTKQLVDIIKAAIPAGARRKGPHPASRTFQAIRIEVNNELEALSKGIEAGVKYLRPGARFCIISFHSLEDRIVKRAFRKLSDPCICQPDAPICICGLKPSVKIITRRPITANKKELELNPRARSAKLRVCEKIDE